MLKIDYTKTIEKFFAEVGAYMDKRIKMAKSVEEEQGLIKSKESWNILAANPRKYINRTYEHLNLLDTMALVNKGDNSVYLAVRNVLNMLADVYTVEENGYTSYYQDCLLNFLAAYKKWKYVSSDSLFKDFIFPFKTAKSFAVMVPGQQR